jgi:hypothetical protein
LNYRGITLLSIVGKVYNRVLTERLVRFAERQGGIVEEQGGFRPERGTEDQLFVLTEILRCRGSRRTTYTAFIDVKKAYDTVWRNGLWKRLWDEGIRGKMWRVVKGMYGVVQSAVLVGDEQTEWFDLSTGVRQGCVLSPILFSLFINGLAREINEKGKGVDIGGRRVRLLMYADDIVLLAESARDLQNMLDVVTAYSRRWRFRVNPKKGKSEVMIFGRKPRNKDRKWRLAGEEVGETCMYKYLGIELRSGLSFKHYKDKIVTEARKRMMLVWAMGMREGMLGVEDCVRAWQALVRPVLEYGTVVWGDVKWEQAEQIQREMGKMILRCSPKMTNEVVLGELGWWTLKGRRDFLTLNYWGKIVGGMSPSRLVYQVYHNSRSRYDTNHNNNNNHGTNRWCYNIHTLLKEIGMEDTWHHNTLTPSEAKQWRSTVKEKIGEREEAQWKERMQHKPKLRTYRQLKTRLIFEQYLTTKDREEREVMTRLRGGTNELRIENGRYAITNRDRPLELDERRCLICMNGEIEDETHFLLDCCVYEDLRQEMLDVVSSTLSREIEIGKARKDEEGRKKILAALGGELFTSEPELRAAVLHFCKRAMRRRNKIVREVLDQKT